MKINRHIRSKSDTMFVMEQKELDNIQANLKLLRTPQSTEAQVTEQRNSRASDGLSIRKTYSRKLKFNEMKESVSFEEFNEIYGSFLHKLFMFKKYFDKHIFEHLSREKHHLNTLLLLIKNNIQTFKASKNLEGETGVLTRVKKFEQCIDIVIQIKPSEYYREIKTMLLNEFEQTRIDIQSFIERCSKGSKLKTTSKYIVSISQIILYLISFVSYRLDYYSLALNCLLQRMKVYSIFYIEGNSKEEIKHVSLKDRNQRIKYLHLIDQFVFLTRQFTQEFYGQATCLLYHNKKSVSLNNFSSCGRYVLNNYIQTYAQNFDFNIENDNYERKLPGRTELITFYWKNYIHQFKNLSTIKLDKYFRLFFNLKLVVWKNWSIKIDKNIKASEICRICEQSIPINDYILHINYCREQRIFYEQNRIFKQELEKIIKELKEYNDTYIKERNMNVIYNQSFPLMRQLKRIARSHENILEPKEKISDLDLLNNLVKIFQDEANLPLDYYEKNTYKFPQVISLIYFTLFLYIINKRNLNGTVEINKIFASFFSCLVSKMVATEYILTVQESKTKSNIKNTLRIREEAKIESQTQPQAQTQTQPQVQNNEECIMKLPVLFSPSNKSIKGENESQFSNKSSESFLWNENNKSRKNKSLDFFSLGNQPIKKFEDEKNNVLEFSDILNSYKSKLNIHQSPMSPYNSVKRSKTNKNSTKESSDSMMESISHSSGVTESLGNQSEKVPNFSLQMKKLMKSQPEFLKKKDKVLNEETKSNNNNDNNNDENIQMCGMTDNDFRNNKIRFSKEHPTRNDTSMDSRSSGLTPKRKGIPKEMPQLDGSPLLSNSPQSKKKKSLFGNILNQEDINPFRMKSTDVNNNKNLNMIQDIDIDDGEDDSIMNSSLCSYSSSSYEISEDDQQTFKYTEMNEIFTSLITAKSSQEDKYYYLKDNQKTSVNMKLKASNSNLIKLGQSDSNISPTKPYIPSSPRDDIKAIANPTINDFTFIKKIAEGGYGRVDIYKKKTTGDMYAIKSVNISKMKNKNLSATLKKETMILNEINSDYVVKCYYIFNDTSYYYYVMEYMPGGDLLGLLNSIVLPQSTIQLIVAETILSLLYLHSKNIIHRDIKPENILISIDGHFKITDFGLSESEMKKNKYAILHSNQNFEQLDQSIDKSVAVGTLNYMAPEMLFSSCVNENINTICSSSNNNSNFKDNGNCHQIDITEAVDYWALGILIYELYTFKVPFYAQSPSEIKANIVNMNIDWYHLESDETKENYTNIAEAKDFILHFLQRDPALRWSDGHFELMKKHPFFANFNWSHIKDIKDNAVRSYVSKSVKKTSIEIKKFAKKRSIDKNEGVEVVDNTDTQNKQSGFFCKRVDNLFSKSQDIVKEKFRKEELSINEDNNIDSLIDDLK